MVVKYKRSENKHGHTSFARLASLLPTMPHLSVVNPLIFHLFSSIFQASTGVLLPPIARNTLGILSMAQVRPAPCGMTQLSHR